MKKARHCDRPSVFLIEELLDPTQIDLLLDLSRDESLLADGHVSTRRDEHGSSLELPVTLDPLLETIASRMREVSDLPGAQIPSLRMRIVHEGQHHPPHFDRYESGGAQLVATVLLTLEAPARGGETSFPHADCEEPLRLAPAAGDALLWYNVASDLEGDPWSWHEGLAVQTGRKITLAGFLYAPIDALLKHAEHEVLAPAPEPRERLYLLTDRERGDLEDQLERAALVQGVTLVEIDVTQFDHADPLPLEDGAMLYRTATSHEAHVVEQILAHPGVVTFYTHPLGAHIIHDNQSLMLARCGISTPRAIFVLTTRRSELRQIVDRLGGFPVILKVPGRSLGIGVMRIADFPALFSVVDQVYATHGKMATLMSAIEPARHWRVIVVGEAHSCYLNQPREDDFRTHVDECDRDAFFTPAPDAVVEIAHEACAVLGFETGGVDVLEHESGRVYVLEVNYPCYFGHPRGAGSDDVAAMMISHLRQKASRMRALHHAAVEDKRG